MIVKSGNRGCSTEGTQPMDCCLQRGSAKSVLAVKTANVNFPDHCHSHGKFMFMAKYINKSSVKN